MLLVARCLPLALFLSTSLALTGPAGSVPAAPGTAPVARTIPALIPALIQDPAVREGTLANGMRYLILRNTTPKGQAAVRLRIGSGSLQETDAQQGLAHFLEHMAFKGSTHVPANEMVKILQRKGLAFGPDTNAFTAWTQTVYMLDLPETDTESLDTGLMLMRETAGELALAADAVEPERGVVLSEERVRDSPGYRAMKARLQAQLEGQLAASRFPIGKVEIIKTAPASELARYYRANYRPDRATLIVVGDVDPTDIEARIRTRFGDWKAVGPAVTEPDLGTLKPRGPRAQLMVIPGAPNTIELSWLKPFDATPDGPERRARETVEGLALAVLNRRLERLSRGDHPPFLSAGAGSEPVFRSADVTSLRATTSPETWRTGVTAIIAEVRRFVEFGVLPEELKREMVDTRTGLVNEAASAGTRRTPDLASELVNAVDERRIFNTPQSDLALFDAVAGKVTLEDVNRAARTVFSGTGPLLQMNAPAPIDGGEPALAAAIAEANAARITPPAREAAVQWPYTTFGTAPGKVADTRMVSDLGATQVMFANGVALTVKPTKFKTDEVLVNVKIGTGRSTLPSDPNYAGWASQAVTLGGLRQISLEDMERVLTGRTYSARFQVADDGMVLQGAAKPADLDTQMQVLAAYTTDAGWRPEAFDRLRVAMSNALTQFEATATGVLGREIQALLTRGDPRFRYPDAARLAGQHMDDLQRQLSPQLANGAIEVTIVGDITEAQAVDAVAKTFGALPKRTPPNNAARLAALNPVRFPAAGEAEVTLTHKGRTDQALALVAWPTLDFFADPHTARATSLLQDVLENRLVDQVRVAEGATYSPQGDAQESEVYPGYGYLMNFVETPPDKVEGFFRTARQFAADLRAHAPTPDELTRAVTPRVERVLKAQQTNNYWLGRLSGSIGDPRRLDIIRSAIADYRSVTPQDLQAAANRFLTDKAEFRLKIVAAPAKP
jgi:zinc protease